MDHTRADFVDDDVRELILLGCSYLDRGQYARARDALEKALAQDPHAIDAQLNLALLAQRSDDLESAWTLVHEGLKLHGDDADLINLRGVLHAKEGARRRELEDFSKALELCSAHREARFNVAAAHLERGHPDTALEHVERLKTLCPGEGLVHYLDGLIKASQGRQEAEEAAYRRALEMGEETADVYHNLGLVLFERGRFDEAESCLKKALDLDPTALDIHLNLASALHERGDDHGARKVLERATRFHEDCADVWYNLGYVSALLGLDQEAIEAYSRAIRNDGSFADAHYNLAFIHFRRKDYERSIAAYRRVLELAPDRYRALYNLAFALDTCGRHEEALEVWKKTLSHRPDDHKTYSKMALAYLALGEAEKARVACERSLELEPHGNVEAAYCRAVIAETSGDDGAARDGFETVLQYDTGFRDALVRLSNLLRKSGRAAEALERAREALAVRKSSAGFLALGLACEDLGQDSKALAILEKGLRRRPGNLRLLRAVTRVAFRVGVPAKAIAAHRSAVEAEPSSSSCRLRCARVLERAKQYEAAVAEAKEAIRHDSACLAAYMIIARSYLALGKAQKAMKYRTRFKNLKKDAAS